MLNYFYDESQKMTIDIIGTRFLLAQLLMDSFQSKVTVREVKSALQKLPQGSNAYDSAYEDAMTRIFVQGEGSSKMAKKILAWILCAHRPLSTLELLHALAIEPGDTEIDEDNILEVDQIFTICSGLVTIDEHSDSVRFIHYTVQEYLQRNQETWLPHANIHVSRTCIAYVSVNELDIVPCSSQAEYEHRSKRLPLLEYATLYWGAHMNLLLGLDYVDELDELISEARALLLHARRLGSVRRCSLMLTDNDHDNISDDIGKGFSSSHWLGYFGILPFFKDWLSGTYELDPKDGQGRSPLSFAAANGHEETVKLLLGTGTVNVDSRTRDGASPLLCAARNGHHAIVQLLLTTCKADVDSRDMQGRTPLLWAIRNGHEAIVKLLLSTGKADVNLEDHQGRTPLLWAVRNARNLIVKLLLDDDNIAVDSEDVHGQTPLSWAAENGDKAITQLLLETGKVKVNSRDRQDQTPLLWAARNGHSTVVDLLLGKSEVDVDSKARCDWHEAMVQLLSSNGTVNPDSRAKCGKTPLW